MFKSRFTSILYIACIGCGSSSTTTSSTIRCDYLPSVYPRNEIPDSGCLEGCCRVTLSCPDEEEEPPVVDVAPAGDSLKVTLPIPFYTQGLEPTATIHLEVDGVPGTIEDIDRTCSIITFRPSRRLRRNDLYTMRVRNDIDAPTGSSMCGYDWSYEASVTFVR